MKTFTSGEQVLLRNGLVYLYCSVWMNLILNVDCVRIAKGPEDVFVVVGSQAELSCWVADETTQDIVIWKKMSNNFPDMISYNDWSLKPSKYLISARYRRYQLFIREVSLSDEGTYECQAGAETVRARLTVTVPVYNMSLEWDLVKPFPLDTVVNVTCQTFHSKPPADITWLLGVRNVSDAATYNKSYGEDGFGDAISVMPVDTGSGIAGMPYRCIAQVPGQKIEEAPSLLDYVVVIGFSSSGNTMQINTMFRVLTVWFSIEHLWLSADY